MVQNHTSFHEHHRYWFRPARFWNWFAAYYPVRWEGWAITFALAMSAIYLFRDIDGTSHSASDTLIRFSPRAILIFLIFDFVTRLTGEYPSWWHGKRWHWRNDK